MNCSKLGPSKIIAKWDIKDPTVRDRLQKEVYFLAKKN